MGQRGGDHSLPFHLGPGNGLQVVHFREIVVMALDQ